MEETKMSVINKYKEYRKVGIKLNHKVINTYLDRGTLWNAGKILGIIRGEDTFLFDSEDETSVLMDFALNDCKKESRSIVEIYREKVKGENEIEREILDALVLSYTSLFQIVSISEAENAVYLRDLLNNRENIKLTDISLSKSAVQGFLIFTRIVSCKDFNMTSGVSFVFPKNSEENILLEYRAISEKLKFEDEQMKRFISFHKLSKIYGVNVEFR